MRVNLLPPEILERQKTRRRAVLVGTAGVVVIVLLVGFAFIQQQRKAQIDEEVGAQESINAGLQQEIASLQEFDLLQQELAASRGELSVLLLNEILWSGVLRDISLVIPGEAWLSSFSGSIFTPENTPIVEGQTEIIDTGLIGQVSFSGLAFDHRVVALWLSRLEEVEGFVNPWLDNSEHVTIGTSRLAQFVSTVDLSESAAVVQSGAA